MQRKDSAPAPRRRRDLREGPNPESILTRAAGPAPREVTERVGTRPPSQARPARAVEPTAQLGGWLRDPGNLRRAMLLQVVLGPPKALRPDEER